MESDIASDSGTDTDFGFAFDDSNFSDRILTIEIMPDVSECGRNRKRRREESEDNDVDVVMPGEERILNLNRGDEDAVRMIQESPSTVGVNTDQHGDEATQNDELSPSMDNPTVLIVKRLHISSAILAAKSPFFYKLFSNGMKESEQRDITLRIHASEEKALMELLNFMYSNKISINTPSDVIDLIMVADKFDVCSCTKYCCSRLLRNIPMTCDSALLLLQLSTKILSFNGVQPLINAAKHFLADHYKDITKFEKEVLNLPLEGMEAVLSSDNLQVGSEDEVYDFVLKWAQIHFPNLEERCEIISTRLRRLVRLPYITSRKLVKVALDALFFKLAQPLSQQKCHQASREDSRRLVRRAYKYLPVKVVKFELPRKQCIVYLDLNRQECQRLFPNGVIQSQAFCIAGQEFCLSAHCNMDQQRSSSRCFGLCLEKKEKEKEKGVLTLLVDFEFSVRRKSNEEFVSKFKYKHSFTGMDYRGCRNLCGIPWDALIAKDSPYFINNVLHLMAVLTISPNA